ncbi:MAG: radical SAM family heme chaperone HemW [Ignavibacteriaceae bacterium]|nr:radical SAM family heme chaperone HemW [Ignavibacteriaceae bacterium]
MKDSAIYIHIPFCDHKCIYCDFYSIITSDNIGRFLTSLKSEIQYYADKFSSQRIYSSIYFGGGTPSLMEPGYLHEIISYVKNNFKISEDAEISMETNPGTVDEAKLRLFRKAGINRISIGIQSFDNDDLKFLTRIHDKDTAIKTVLLAKEIGFDNINVDLIFNLPGQTKEKWKSNLQQAVELPVKHISAYSLILERGTILNKMVLDGKVAIQDDDYDAELYEITIDFLNANGFLQYEVSNFCEPGYECRHNNAYWRYRDYLSFGPSAHSFVDGRRWWNFSSLKHYISEIEKNGTAVAGYEDISSEMALNEYIMLALRSKGLDFHELERKFGGFWLQRQNEFLTKLSEQKLILFDNNFISLTPKGYAICDEILSRLL